LETSRRQIVAYVTVRFSGRSSAIRFLTEVAQGNRLYLGTATGEPVMEYSLAGSNASMRALGECGDALAETDRNPFD
jgi:hypothetical protein